MNDASIVCERTGHVLRVTLNRPGDGNELDERMAQELVGVCSHVSDDDDIYVVTLTGAGNAFCRGAAPEAAGLHPAAAIAAIDRPVIVGVNGDALGEGLELALAGDIRIAADSAHFGMPQVAGGRIPVDGGTQRLPRIIGRGRALEILLAAEEISAAGALEAGLVRSVVPAASLADELAKLAETVAARGPIALRYLKEAVNKGMDMTLEQGLRLEADLYFLLHTTADRTEGIRAFQEKRPPDFRGE